VDVNAGRRDCERKNEDYDEPFQTAELTALVAAIQRRA
jgi:hypothetical protein